MSCDTSTRFEQSSNGHAAGTQDQHGTAGQAGSGTQTATSRVNEAADERAFQLRSEGHTYKQIGDEMGVDASMAHRRVKRHAMRQKMYRDEKLEEAREFEFEKMRQMEKALLPDATDGDHASIKLVLRIMELRRKYLKDIPLDRGDRMPAIEERAQLLAEVVDEESAKQGQPDDCEWTEEDEEKCWEDIAALAKRGGGRVEGSKSERVEKECDQQERRTPNKEPSNFEVRKDGERTDRQDIDPKTAALFSQLLTEATARVRQELARKEVAANEEESTKGSMEESMTAGGEGTEAQRQKAQRKGSATNATWHGG